MMLNLLDCRLLGGNIKLTMYFNFNNTVQDPVNTKVPAAKYYKRIKPESTDIKPKKTKDPAPGSYEIEDCYRKT